jgi:Na+-transporting NADH:ubiquinone oxidoreductase subunit F
MIYMISTIVFTLVILLLVFLLLFIENKVISTEDCKLTINNDPEKSPTVSAGSTLLSAFTDNGIFLPSGCGGGGTCGMCKCEVSEGGGSVLPTELSHLDRKMIKDNVRLACQVKVKNDMSVEIPEEIFSIKQFKVKVISNDNVATFIKELKMELAPGEDLDFKAGGYIQIDIPAHDIQYKDYIIGDEYRADWDTFNLWQYHSVSTQDEIRAYSMANYPAEKGIVMLTVRIASPPPRTEGLPPGVGSSYIFNLKPGDEVNLSGPYGEFFVQETEREMCFIGGGAGMAPMRSHVFDQLKTLKTKRKVSFWYGARSRKEMFYDDEFQDLSKDNDNFTYNVALSNATDEDKWDGMTGFIHQALLDNYLKDHEDPTEIEYYLCGPPMMIDAVVNLLDELGVEEDMIRYDKF